MSIYCISNNVDTYAYTYLYVYIYIKHITYKSIHMLHIFLIYTISTGKHFSWLKSHPMADLIHCDAKDLLEGASDEEIWMAGSMVDIWRYPKMDVPSGNKTWLAGKSPN